MACDPSMLTDVELFEHLDEEDRRSLAAAIDLRRLAAGDILFHAGEPGESLYIVRSGEIELYIRDTAGQKIPLTIACANQVFGELALHSHHGGVVFLRQRLAFQFLPALDCTENSWNVF